ncbi:MAG TPA: hypothetical protein VF412_07365 [Bdellovibrio sp.]|uniref:hypothetical protein n=1 Tax=Bdellovibrio sp. TaxID=28201 RepID=UPI002EE5F6ED
MKSRLKLFLILMISTLASQSFGQRVITNGTVLDIRCDVTLHVKQEVMKLVNMSARDVIIYDELARTKVSDLPNGKLYSFPSEEGEKDQTVMSNGCLSLTLTYKALATKAEANQLIRLDDGRYLDVCWWIADGIHDNNAGDDVPGFINIKLFGRRLDADGYLSLSLGDQLQWDAPNFQVTGQTSVNSEIAGLPVEVSCHYK